MNDFIIIILCILGAILIIEIVGLKYKDMKEEETRCPDCGQIPLKPDPRFTESRAKADEAFLKTGRVERCSCGELKVKENF